LNWAATTIMAGAPKTAAIFIDFSDMDRSHYVFLSLRPALPPSLDLHSGRALPFYASGSSMPRMVGRYSETVG
jgi:hypothetical protein